MGLRSSSLLLALTAVLLLPETAFVQPPEIIWYYYWPGSYTYAYSALILHEDSDGCTFAGTLAWILPSEIGTRLTWLDSDGDSLRDVGVEGVFEDGAATEDGGYIIASTWTDNPYQGHYGMFYKFSDTGELEWWRILGGDDGGGRSADETPDGGYILCGSLSGPDGTIWRTDASGNTLWVKTWPEIYFRDVLVLEDGRILISGTTSTHIAMLMETDPEGGDLWLRTYYGCSLASSLVQTDDGGFAFSGESDKFLMVKTDDQGQEQWRASFDMPGGHASHSVEQTMDGGYVISGLVHNGIVGHCPAIVRTDSSGDLLWEESLVFPAADSGYPTHAVETQDGGYYVAGMDGFIVVRLAPPLGTGDQGEGHGPLTLGSPSPNPFGSAVQISYSLADEASVAASVYDLSGRCVAKLTEGMESSGQHSLIWDGTGMNGMPCPNGIYLITVSAGGTALSKSAILLR
jgi:hypothetical protein